MRAFARVAVLGRSAAAVRWYVRELLGDADYDRYVERHARRHPDDVPLSRRGYWRERYSEAEREQVARCC